MNQLSPLPQAKPALAAIADFAQRQGKRIACAESLTGGHLAAHLAAGEAAGQWFAGGVVGYSRTAKQQLLGVGPGPVVSAKAAGAMALGVGQVLGADYAVAVTGVGGPDRQDGQEVGTVFIATWRADGICHTQEHHFGPQASEILTHTVLEALAALLSACGLTLDGSRG